ncbi:putative frv operon regulatory protein [Enterobacter huaxiensis]|uniref:Frv operon regulatory protein n=1 Tax=Enterobacter huaxiensis TaxID=2494702 RepID=A0ABU6EYZ5_9ENTR|nr:putative frv operon regulatory protein [Enterobacter huaxiensis]MEB7545199.1 putative frv operon regulatory protein [Enterobacter huaxiensis]MEB7583450.1 putative frv operon regulatory protein [Enterobacter huaxiensis]MEB7665651.1 putative frv operon regulatory protein [Enterobacter huaxiensis]
MLNERQFALLDELESQPVSLSVLARQTGVSARTILRDIDYLNFTLSGKARIRAMGSTLYQLDMIDRKGYFQLLQRHDNDDRMLALLLIHPVISRAQLADALNLPDAWVAERLPRLKVRHARAFTLASRPGSGHYVAVGQDKRIILLANLFRKDPFVYPLAGITTDTFATLQEQCRQLTDWPDVATDYVVSTILAAYALRQHLIDTSSLHGNHALKPCTERAGIWINPVVLSVLAKRLDSLQQQANGMTPEYVTERLAANTTAGQPHIVDAQLIEDLTGHLKRCVAMPQWLAENRQGSMNNLKAAWPAAFDMSVKFINHLRTVVDIPLIDSDLPGLYFACALERHHHESTPVILLSDQNAIATINKMAIEREVLNCRVMVVRTPEALWALCDELTPGVVINNSHYPLDDRQDRVLTIRNIISAAGIDQIKDYLASAFIRQQPERFFPQDGDFHYHNAPGESWAQIVNGITARLCGDKCMSSTEAQRICQREREGENLIVNRIAIPHCWSERPQPFRGYFITLESSVCVNGDEVRHVLMACASAANRQELKIFSFLASVLSRHSPETIEKLKHYGEFMALLR